MATKRILSISFTALFLCAAISSSGQAIDWKQIKNPPLHPFHPQEPKRIQLPNGMVIFLQEDHELPLIGGNMRIRGGSREVPAEKVGMIGIYDQTWRTGGTKNRTGDQLDDQLEALAAKVETGGGLDSTSISFDCLKQDFDAVFTVFVDVLRNPEFRENKVELAKKQVETGISRRNDDIDEIAGREATKIGYGSDSPYARTPEYSTVNAVTRADLLSWHKEHVQPNNIILGIAGDFDSAQMEAKLLKAFSSWPKGSAFEKKDVPVKSPAPGIYFVAKDDVDQSEIRMISLGIRRDNPDYYAIQIMNEVLGGGFSSRLFTNVRSKLGLAYSVGGGVGASFDHPGLLNISMGTKSQSTVAAVNALYHEIDDIVKNPPSADEMNRARDSILNSFIFHFDSKSKVLNERMAYEFYGYPADFLEKYRAGIEKTTADDVAAAARRHVNKGKMAVLVVGKAAEFDKPLSTLGATVTNVDITIPEAAGAAPAAGTGPGLSPATLNPATSSSSNSAPVSAASKAEGKALALQALNAYGGVAKLKDVKSFERKGTIAINSPNGPMEIEIDSQVLLPDKARNTLQTPNGEMVMVFTPTYAFADQGSMGVHPLPKAMADDGINALKRTAFYLANHLDDPAYSFSANGSEKIGATVAKIVDIHADGSDIRWYVDPENGRLLKAAFKATGMSGPVDRTIEYSDWKSVDGFMVPYKEVTMDNGSQTNVSQITELKFNPGLDPKVFEKPK